MEPSLHLLLAITPAICLFVALAFGWRPGERTLARIVEARTRRVRTRAPRVLRPKPRAPRVIVAAGDLIALSLATRPPPAPAAI